MLFQSLDTKEKCVGIYQDGKLSYQPKYEELTKTWGYSSFLRDKPIEYASLYCNGKAIEEVCPESLKEDWGKISSRLRAFLISFREAKIDLDENCFFDLVPERFLMEFCEVKNQITEYVFDSHIKPKNYNFLYDLTQLVDDMSYTKLNTDLSVLRSDMAQFKVRQFIKKIKKVQPCVKYNIFGTKTGRLTTKKNSFPILTLDKDYRKILKPNNDWFVEFDYNAAELRTLLGLLEKEQPIGDLHDWNAKHVYQSSHTREEAKKRIFSWLYNPAHKDYLSSRAYDRDSVVQKYYNQGQVSTFFDRTIPADDHHALNYIIQSTCSDLILRQALKVNKLLAGTKTRIAFMIHDSIVLDMSTEEESRLNEILKTFADTCFGTFETNVKAGKNFGDMKRLWIHS